MKRYGWATIHEITESGFYAFKVGGEIYQLAKENMGALTYENLAKITGSNISYLKQVFATDFNALDCDAIIILNKDDVELARDWIEGLYFWKKAEAI